MDNWLCTICETINTTANTNANSTSTSRRGSCVLCNTYKHRNEKQFTMNLTLNKRIDEYLPRHIYDLELRYVDILLIGGVIRDERPNIYKYIRNRLHYRTHYINKNWRRKICYKRYLNIILKYINHHHVQIERNLILQYLLPNV